MTASLMMAEDSSPVTEKVLNLSIEIITLLNGESFTTAKSGDMVTIMVPPYNFMIPKKMKERILEITNEITELLTGEVPVRCQDVAVYLSMEEREYLERHKERYKAAMMEEEPADGSRKRNPSERCPRPLYSRDSAQKKQEIPHHGQLQNFNRKPRVKDEETARVVTVKEEDVSPEVGQEGSRKGNHSEKSPFCLVSRDSALDEHGNLLQDQSEGREVEIIPVLVKDVEMVIPLTVKEEEVPREVSNSEDHITTSRNRLSSSGCKMEDGDGVASNTHPELTITYQPSDSTSPAYTATQNSKQSKGKPFQCSDCGKCFTHKETFAAHQRLHTGERLFTCPQCGKVFVKKSRLNKHQRSHTGEKPFSCTECGKCFTWKSNLIQHQVVHTGEKPFKCVECGRGFSLKQNLAAHEKTHSGGLTFECPECSECFTRKLDLSHHERLRHGEKILKCSKCAICFTDKLKLMEHEKSHREEKSLPSPTCDNNEPSLANHKEMHRENDTFRSSGYGKGSIHNFVLIQRRRTEIDVEPFPSLKCDKSLSCKSSLGHQQQKDHEDKPFKCLECGKCFATNFYLIEHKRTHTGDKTFPCPKCDKRFSNKSNLLQHEKTHRDDRPFKCAECGKCFTSNYKLTAHKRSHTGEKPFPCPKCDKRFSHKSSLALHEQTHLEDKPFKCSECGKGFTMEAHIILHLRTHTGEKPYQCPECGKCFSQKSTLSTHQRVHLDVKPFACSECGRSFVRRADLLGHQRKHKKP